MSDPMSVVAQVQQAGVANPASGPLGMPAPQVAGVTPQGGGGFFSSLVQTTSQVREELTQRVRSMSPVIQQSAATAGFSGGDPVQAAISEAFRQLGLEQAPEGPELEGWVAEMAERGQDRFVVRDEQGNTSLDVEVMAYDWLTQMNVNQLRNVQRMLFTSGRLTSAPVWGRLDPATLQAAREWLAFASMDLDTDPYSQLLDLTEGVGMMGPEDFAEMAALSPDPIQVILDNPEELMRTIDDAYRTAGMKRPTDDDRRAFVTAFHAFQRRAAEANLRYRSQVEDAMAAGDEMVETVGLQSAETFTQNFVRAQDPVAYEGEKVDDAALTVSRLARGGAV